MKQKYVIIKDEEKNAMVLQEHAELDKELLSLLCEETYAADMVADAVSLGKAAVVSRLRTRNMYPPSLYMDKIADQVIALYQTGAASAEVVFDDIELIVPDHEPMSEIEIDDESADLDDLLDDEDDALDDEFGDDDDLNISSNATLKIADDESLDIDDDA